MVQIARPLDRERTRMALVSRTFASPSAVALRVALGIGVVTDERRLFRSEPLSERPRPRSLCIVLRHSMPFRKRNAEPRNGIPQNSTQRPGFVRRRLQLHFENL